MKIIRFLPIVSLILSTVFCDASHDCRVSIPGQKIRHIKLNTDLLVEAGAVTAHPPYRLPQEGNKDLIGLLKELYASAKQGKLLESKKIDVLKHKDWSGLTGSAIVKLNDQPFVAKIFRADLGSFGRGTGIAQRFMWLINRVNRYLLGFTRLGNRDRLVSWLEKSKYAKDFRDTFVVPRKWSWIPDDAVWITVAWKDEKGKKNSVQLPETYMVVCDAYAKERGLNISEKKMIFKLLDAVPSNVTIDPNPTNFFVDKNGKIIFIDTENVDYIVGRHTEPVSYGDWYAQLAIASIETFVDNLLSI